MLCAHIRLLYYATDSIICTMPSIMLFVLCRNVRLPRITIQLYSAHIVLCMYLGILSIILQSEAIEKLPEGQQTFAILADAFRIDVY